jgi:hypothetical protein
MTITAICNLVPDSRTTRGSAWHAIATVNDVTYSATSRSSAVAALCRELVAGGVPDGSMAVTFNGVAGEMIVRSIHKFAGTTLTEGDGPIHRTAWRPFESARLAAAGSRYMGEVEPAAIPGPCGHNVSAPAPPLSVTCEGCGQPFTPRRSDAKTCGPACRKRVSRRLAA